MDNNKAVLAAIVSRDASRMFLDDAGLNWGEIFSDFSKMVISEYNAASIDKRNVAVGTHNNDLWLFELMQNPTPDWKAIMEWPQMTYEQVLMVKSPKKLFVSGTNLLWGITEYLKVNPSADMYVMNDHHLGLWEKHYELASGSSIDIGYSVIDRKELDGEMNEKFDFISMYTWDLDHDNTLLNKLVNLLEPSGVLLIGLSNMSEGLYEDGVLHHPFGEMHQFLKEQNGFTYHVPGGHGYTVFIKR